LLELPPVVGGQQGIEYNALGTVHGSTEVAGERLEYIKLL
jgi:hypothetical protein